jgi:uncharacterized protein YuzE
MRISYDPKYNIAYIAFRSKRKVAKTLPLSDQLNVDIAPDGTVYGIELLDAKSQLHMTKQNAFTVVNDATGKSTRVSLAGA